MLFDVGPAQVGQLSGAPFYTPCFSQWNTSCTGAQASGPPPHENPSKPSHWYAVGEQGGLAPQQQMWIVDM
eukprot:CAMPEP_0181324112 /NCGR_PEP_ID=MMETSP1101-20121128/20172_1 /TAXON_ID=46948 /ORGANISM="Rhodomonas abbreviata, Strain Caron Lab Isolate" /LENGTH=70 /DNA_ID=CAMNT_0023432239 /DNA_START=38 /DNA_END=250 /DNA_ORIENTATION=+